ncbi:MAG: D-aminoacyl-tRNA deacylase [Oscillospiraceae bacterium]
MRAVIQLVSEASIVIDGEQGGKIGKGLVVLLGVSDEDDKKCADYVADKLMGLRVFADSEDKLNLSIDDIDGEIMIVSNFTLYGNCKKGNRPSYIKAAKPPLADGLYDYFVEKIKSKAKKEVVTGKFGSDMKISMINDGPVTIIMDTDEIMPSNKK